MYFPAILEGGGPRSGCQHGQVLLKQLLWLADDHLLTVSSHVRKGEMERNLSSYKATVLSDQSPILMISFIILPSRDPVFRYSHFGGQSFNILILGRRISVQKNSLTVFLFNIILEHLFSSLTERRMNTKEWNK